MMRTSRAITAIIGSLALGTTAAIATVAATATIIGCSSKDEPEYWVNKLEEPKWRQRAIKRLDQFLQDALTRASDPEAGAAKLDDPEIKPLVDKMIEPLVNVYLDDYGSMDTTTRVMAIRLIASCRDSRGEPALRKAMEDFVALPKDKGEEQDIKWAVRAQEDLKLPGLAGPLLRLFQKFEAHTNLGSMTYKDLNDAMVAAPDKGWIPALENTLDAEIKSPDPGDKTTIDRYRDQLFWQTVSAQLLGELGSASSVTPLMKVILDPAKADISPTALLALVKIGKPALTDAISLLTGKAKELELFHIDRLMKYRHLERPLLDDSAVQTAAVVLGTIGRPEAQGPMINLLKSTRDSTTKAVLLREIAKLPATAETKKAFEQGFEQLSIETQLPPGDRLALPQLVEESAVRFHDANMVDWLLERASKAEGNTASVKDLHAAILNAVLKLAKADQLDNVKLAVEKYGTPDPQSKEKAPATWWSAYYEGPLYVRAEALLRSCGNRPACYLSKLESYGAESQDKNGRFIGIKAGFMLAQFGDQATAQHIVGDVNSLEDPTVRYEAAQAVDYLLSAGSLKVADQLNAIIEGNKKRGDRDRIAADQPLREVMYRIRTRAD